MKKTKTLRDGTPVQPLILKMLKKRGVITSEAIKDFLEPQLKDLPAPNLMQDLKKGAAIVGKSIVQNNSILIWGDYDVDGTTATALLLLFLKGIGHKKVDYYIPNRLKEGYGLQAESLKKVCANSLEKEKVLITVDNGISAHNAVKTAKELGYTVVVTDHHTPPETSVQADAILNPRQNSCSFPGKNLSGVGVAFYLAIGIRTYLQEQNYFNADNPEPNLKQFLGLVAVGTVADMVELDATNRILVRAGFESIADGSNPGIRSLCDNSNLDSTLLRSEDVAFQLAPKINAAGRLGVADKAVSLMVSRSVKDATPLCLELIQNNETRKNITISNFNDALGYINKSNITTRNTTVVAGDLHIGVAGIVASQLVEKYGRPAIVLCAQGSGLYKGSARSVDGVNLYEMLYECRDLLIGYGGHAMAAGMSLNSCDLTGFMEKFDQVVYEQTAGCLEVKVGEAGEEASVSRVFDKGILEQLLLLEPHGTGNPQPVFYDPSVMISNIKRIGKDKSHLRMTINNETTNINGIGFGLGEQSIKCENSQGNRIVFSPSLNFFRGKRNWQARVMDIQSSSS